VITDYGDALLNSQTLPAFGFGPRRLGHGSRPVAAARRSRKAGDPRGRPIVSAARNAETASADGAVSIRSPKRPRQRSISGATLTAPSPRKAQLERFIGKLHDYYEGAV
jgi:hypothetical protein